MAKRKELRAIGVTRRIDGKIYTLVSHDSLRIDGKTYTFSKKDAWRLAKNARKRGRLVRIVKMIDGYYIYSRRR